MAFTESAWIMNWIVQGCYSNGDTTLTHRMRAALYDNTLTPDKGAGAYARYGQTPWTLAREVHAAPGWPPGGMVVPASAAAVPPGEDTVRLAGDPVLSSAPVTMTPGPYGDLVYDDESQIPIGKMGFAFHYYGGPVEVTAGTFAIIWDSEGVAVLTAELLPAP